MVDFKEPWKIRIAGALNKLLLESGNTGLIETAQIIVEIPPKLEMGDLGFPMFSFAKVLKKGPPCIAQGVAAKLAEEKRNSAEGTFTAEGPYVNVRLNRGKAAAEVLEKLLDEHTPYCRPETLKGSRIMVEFSSPNTNKPLHLGHLRNDVLGESISRILKACGAEVQKVCIINDRGIHICKSMLAYREHGEGKTPESEGIKSDHFVGNWYVKFSQMTQESPKAEEGAQEMLRKWEAGDTETIALWKRMNHWTLEGMKETYRRTGISFDQYYFESETYLKGKNEILKALEQGIFHRAEDGSVWIDLTEEQLDKKVLLRKDGTSLYITQDIGTAIYRQQDWPFDHLVYVVGSEQQYHFKVLFTILDKLGFGWAKNLYHLSYGMVNLRDGKMKSREGTVVDADALLDSLKALAFKEIQRKERENAVGDPEATAEKIALGALHYYLIQVSPVRDMLFNPQESLSFNGNTGPYLQYMGARISSLLRKDSQRNEGDLSTGAFKPELLTSDAEWELLKTLESYPSLVANAAAAMDPSLVAGYLYELSKGFSRFYHDCPILRAENPDLAVSRLCLAQGALRVLREALELICIPFLETM
ncbi:MAG: arginine--tRNA ligase [Treponema sp.]|jgi:arginyl-tRNA synthetase|nr:arginine--tRNA ligase [Treponema sp.]